MLSDNTVIATVAVKDLATARAFYEEKLGLTPDPAQGAPENGVVSYRCGSAALMVYVSDFAGTNRATAATWPVADADAVVAELRGRGVAFEHYDFPGGSRDGDVHVFGTIRNAWFKDPDGNILSIVSG